MAMIDPVTPDVFREDPRFPDPHLLRLDYDRKRDTLTVSVENPGPALSIDMGDGMWMRFVPATREVVGFEIEDYERVFLRKHPAIADAWRTAQGRRLLGVGRKGRPEQFYDYVIRCLKHAFATHPRQFLFPA